MKNNYTHWISLLSIAVMAVLLVACNGSAKSGESNENVTTIKVLASDYSFSLRPSRSEAGTIKFVVQNNGSIQHDFSLNGNGIEQKTVVIDPGKSEILEVDLQPGTNTYVCTIPGHEESGMTGILTVEPSS